MTAEALRRVTGAVLAGGLVLVVAVALVGIGATIPTQPLLGLAAGVAALAVGLSALHAATLPLLAMPLVLIVARLAPAGVDVSTSDVALFAAFWPALFLARRGYTRPMRSVLWLAIVYQALTLLTVVANPFRANTIDWFHTFFLVIGGLVVGWAVGREGHARTGLSLIMLTGAALAVVTIGQGLVQLASGNLGPVYVTWPFPMHKNFTGTTLAAVAVMAYVRPAWMHWSRRSTLLVFWLCIVGVLFAQSRQGLVGLALTMLVVVLRRETDRRRSKIVLVIVPLAMAMVALTVKLQIDSGNRFNSSSTRLELFRQSIDIWLQDPWFGVGLRWWYTDRFPVQFQPPNAELEVLTTAGVVGLVGFAVLMIGTLRVTSRMDAAFGMLPFAIVLNRFVQGQLDLFWVSVAGSLPFVVVGICCGAQAWYDDRGEAEPAPTPGHEEVVARHARRTDRA